MRQRVAITGISCISSFGIGPRALAEALLAGGSGVRSITEFDTSASRSHAGAMLGGFEPTAFIPPLKLRRIDAVGRLALVCARLVLQDSGVPLAAGGTEEIGIALGSLSAGMDSTIDYLKGLTAGGPMGAPALLFSNTVPNAPASLCAIEHGLRGPNVTFNQREASSLAAIAFAAGAIRDARAGSMISGGADRLEPTFFAVQAGFGSFSEDGVSRPFDRRRCGFVPGEAAAFLLLESTTSAADRDADVYGELLGIGASGSRTRLNDWPETADGPALAMQAALDDGGITADEVDAIFAAANGSPQLDAIEAEAIRTVFGGREVPVVALKGAIGESGTAAAASLAVGLLTMADYKLPPTVGFAEADPDCRVNVSPDPTTVTGRTFLVNAIASGGTNYSILLRAAPADEGRTGRITPTPGPSSRS
jgi:3-oxoacyl-[acyl-carrier-protein] synthase II